MQFVENMKAVQICTGFIFYTFPASVIVKNDRKVYFLTWQSFLQALLKAGQTNNK